MEDGSVIWHGYIRDETQTKEIELAFEEKSRVLEQFFNVEIIAVQFFNYRCFFGNNNHLLRLHGMIEFIVYINIS
jgi:hypothetical protein